MIDISLPASSRVAGYDQEAAAATYQVNKELEADRYSYEKMMGDRRSDGALKLQKLKPVHKEWISAYINGVKGVDIAEKYNVSAISVYRVLSDPLAKSLIGEFDEAFINEFKSMFPLVANAVRDGLSSGSALVKLQAVDRFVKVSRMLLGDEGDGTAGRAETVLNARVNIVNLINTAGKSAGFVLEQEPAEVVTSE